MDKIIIGVLCLFLGWAFLVQNNAYEKRNEFVDNCAEKGGIYSEAQVDWLHTKMLCQQIPEKN